MRKIYFVLLFIILMAITFCGCNARSKITVERAVRELADYWEDLYEDQDIRDSYLEIIHTQIVYIEEDTQIDEFKEYASIVEFELLSNYMGTSPYYSNAKYADCVVFFKDGRCEVFPVNPLRLFSARYYENDYSDIIDSIKDLETQYNKTYLLD